MGGYRCSVLKSNFKNYAIKEGKKQPRDVGYTGQVIWIKPNHGWILEQSHTFAEVTPVHSTNLCGGDSAGSSSP